LLLLLVAEANHVVVLAANAVVVAVVDLAASTNTQEFLQLVSNPRLMRT
jgi:hypothetical protein